jgi:hypothetical protein
VGLSLDGLEITYYGKREPETGDRQSLYFTFEGEESKYFGVIAKGGKYLHPGPVLLSFIYALLAGVPPDLNIRPSEEYMQTYVCVSRGEPGGPFKPIDFVPIVRMKKTGPVLARMHLEWKRINTEFLDVGFMKASRSGTSWASSRESSMSVTPPPSG